ncbi:MAG: TRAP transporter large permease [Gracilibacteraceae bacterium]|jgi:tripartite ATP-independent transporter DctM subunit|nr:TRAP transporter large permease [Gracilibacteraceae bacterium]
MQSAIYFFITLFAVMSVGVPVAVAMMVCGIVLMLTLGYFEPTALSMNVMYGINSFPLMAIPFFVLSGELMSRGGLAKHIVNFAKLLVGGRRGGLGYTAILASMLFAGLSGSGIADAAAIGGMLIPLMAHNNYNRARSAALVSAGGILAPLIPPSNPFIILGTAVNLSISKLFMGSLVPGILIGLGLMVVWFFVVRKDGYQDVAKIPAAEVLPILKKSIPALMMVVIIVGGIRFGLFTPTEAGAFAAVYALLVCKFYYRELSWKELYSAMRATVASTASIVFICGGATMAGYYITLARIPATLASTLTQMIDSPLVLLLSVNALLLFMGMIMDITPNILIFAPILLPVGVAAGFDPYYFAFLIGLNLIIGAITPPIGIVMFVTSKVAGVKVTDLVAKQWPFLAVYVFFLLLYILFPQLYLVPLGWLR